MFHELLTWLGQGENGLWALLLIGLIFAGIIAIIRAVRGESLPWPFSIWEDED